VHLTGRDRVAGVSSQQLTSWPTGSIGQSQTGQSVSGRSGRRSPSAHLLYSKGEGILAAVGHQRRLPVNATLIKRVQASVNALEIPQRMRPWSGSRCCWPARSMAWTTRPRRGCSGRRPASSSACWRRYANRQRQSRGRSGTRCAPALSRRGGWELGRTEVKASAASQKVRFLPEPEVPDIPLQIYRAEPGRSGCERRPSRRQA
jgi:hypothetical protein